MTSGRQRQCTVAIAIDEVEDGTRRRPDDLAGSDISRSHPPSLALVRSRDQRRRLRDFLP